MARHQEDKDTRLLDLVKKGKPEAIDRLFLREVVDDMLYRESALGKLVNYEGFWGYTPLIRAVLDGRKDIVRRLLVHREVATRLLDLKDISINRKAKCGQTPLGYASQMGYADIAQLLAHQPGIEINTKDSRHQTPLGYAAELGHQGIVESLLRYDQTNVNSRDRDSRTPLHAAILMGHQGIVRSLLGCHKIDVNCRDRYGRSPLSYAAAVGQEETTGLLLARKDIDIDQQDNEGKTPLAYAAARAGLHATANIGKQLLTHHASRTCLSHSGRNLLSFAAQGGHLDTFQLLLYPRVSADLTDLTDLTSLASFTSLADSTDSSTNSSTGLSDLSDWADPADLADEVGRTPLSYAASRGNDSIIAVLLNREGVRPDSRDCDGLTPLAHAAMKGRLGAVERLIARANINAKDHQGKTPLAWAASNGHDYIVRLLLNQKNIFADSVDMFGMTPLWSAVEGGHTEAAEHLRVHDDVSTDIDLKFLRRRTRALT